MRAVPLQVDDDEFCQLRESFAANGFGRQTDRFAGANDACASARLVFAIAKGSLARADEDEVMPRRGPSIGIAREAGRRRQPSSMDADGGARADAAEGCRSECLLHGGGD
ncbi:MAG: hypothetical protein AAF192_04985, partial [Pseudomonadota bacterium]